MVALCWVSYLQCNPRDYDGADLVQCDWGRPFEIILYAWINVKTANPPPLNAKARRCKLLLPE